MTMHRMLAAVGVLLLVTVAGCGSGPAEEPAAAEPEASLPDLPPLATDTADGAAPRLVPIFKGEAQLGYLQPVARTQGTTRVTTIKVKNLEDEALAGLTVDELWFDSESTQVAGSPTFRYPRLDPGEVVDVVLEVQMRAGMERSTYDFKHANGTIKPVLMKTMEEEEEEP